jgi:transposase
MRLDDSASSVHESVLARPQREDRCRRWARDVKGAQAARTFGVGATSVKRYVKLKEEGKPLTPGKAPGKKAKLDQSAMKLLEEDLRSRPAVTYEKRADLLNELLGVRVSKSTICRMVGRLGYTRKKDQWVLQKEMNGSEQLGG